MAYEPTQWKAGDTVTSAKLNKMEQGIASHNMIEGIVDNENGTATLNKTWQEIWDNNYTNIMIINDTYKIFAQIIGISKAEYNNPYLIMVTDRAETSISFTCNSPDDYPSYDISSEEQGDSSEENNPIED